MCNFTQEEGIDEFCEKQKLAHKLHMLWTNQTMTASDGQTYVLVKFIQNLEEELDCSI